MTSLDLLKAHDIMTGRRPMPQGLDSYAAYARQMGHPQQSLARWVCAARVANSTRQRVEIAELVRDPTHEWTESLSVIHSAPESDWPALVAAMLAGEWTKETTEARIRGRRARRRRALGLGRAVQ